MNKLVIFTIALFAISQLNAQELKWYNWDEGYEKAKSENKILIVDVYTDWCYWCKVMDKETYAVSSVISKIEKDFIPVKINPEQEINYTYEGQSYSANKLVGIISKNQLRGYPSTVFFFPKTNESYLEAGFIKPESFKQLLDKYIVQK